MKISEVNIHFIKPNNGMIGFASLVLNDELYLGSIGIHQKLNGSGYRLTYPTKNKGIEGFQIYHPIRKELGIAIEEAIFNKLKNVMEKTNAGYNCADSLK